jgi:hypothetical protein
MRMRVFVLLMAGATLFHGIALNPATASRSMVNHLFAKACECCAEAKGSLCKPLFPDCPSEAFTKDSELKVTSQTVFGVTADYLTTVNYKGSKCTTEGNAFQWASTGYDAPKDDKCQECKVKEDDGTCSLYTPSDADCSKIYKGVCTSVSSDRFRPSRTGKTGEKDGITYKLGTLNIYYRCACAESVPTTKYSQTRQRCKPPINECTQISPQPSLQHPYFSTIATTLTSQ